MARAGDPEAIRAEGEAWRREAARRLGAGRAVEETLARALERLGFEARVEGRTLLLAGCPCPMLSPPRPEVVCGLAAAAVEGVLAGAGSPLVIEGRSHDPRRRRCALRLRRGPRTRGRSSG